MKHFRSQRYCSTRHLLPPNRGEVGLSCRRGFLCMLPITWARRWIPSASISSCSHEKHTLTFLSRSTALSSPYTANMGPGAMTRFASCFARIATSSDCIGAGNDSQMKYPPTTSRSGCGIVTPKGSRCSSMAETMLRYRRAYVGCKILKM